MTRAQKVAPLGALLIMFLAVGWVLLPFEFTKGVKCGAPLLGGKPRSEVSVGLVLPEEDCRNKAKSRLLVSAMISLAAAGATAALIGFTPISTQCRAGDHDACRQWWGNLLSDGGGLGCQCECHSQSGFSY